MKKMIKEKTIKTAAIGLSAIMAMSTPMTAMAAEGEAVVPTEPTDPAKENQQPTEKPVAEQADALKNEAHNIGIGTGEVGTADKKVEDLTNKVENDQTLDKEVREDGKELENAHEIATTTNKDNTPNKEISNVESELGKASEQAKEVDNKVAEADKTKDEVNDIVDDVDQTVKDTEKEVNEKLDEVKNATSIESANQAAKDANQAVTDANNKIAEAEKNVADKTKAFEDANQAAKDAAKEYEDAVNNASKLSHDTIIKLEAQKKAADKLKEQAEASLNAAKEEAEKELVHQIIKEEEALANGKGNDWTAADSLFKKIMVGYYLPKELEGEEYTVANDFERFPEDYNKNKFAVKLKDGTIKYYNYKFDKTDKRLIIFEKTWEKEATGEKEYVVKYENGTESQPMSEEEFKKKVANNEIVTDGENYYEKIATSEKPTTEFDFDKYKNEQEKNNNEKTEVTVEKDEKETKEIKVNQDGQIVEQTKGTITTTTVNKGVSLEGSGFETKQDAKKAAEEKLNEAQKDGDTIDNVNYDIKAEASATVEISYVTTFETKIDLSGMSVDRDWYTTVKNTMYNDIDNVFDETKTDEIKNKETDFDYEEYQIIKREMSDDWDCELDESWDGKINKGSLIVTYKKVTKKPVKQSELDRIFNGSDKEEEEVLNNLPNGSQFLNYNSIDGKPNWSTAYYLQGNTVVATEEVVRKNAGKAEEKAKSNAWDAAIQKAKDAATASIDKTFEEKLLKALNITDLSRISTTASIHKKIENKADIFDKEYKTKGEEIETDENKKQSTTSEVTYSYSGTFDKTNVKTEEKVLETKTWDSNKTEERAVMKDVLTNKNFDENIKDQLFITETDEGFLNYKKAAEDKLQNLVNKYDSLINDSLDAAKRVEEARAAVQELEKKIENLKNKSTVKMVELANLSTQLDAAKNKLAEAKKDAEKLNKTVDEIKDELEKKVVELTPTPAPETPDVPSTPAGPITPAGTTTPAGPTTPVAPTVTPAAVTITPVATPLAANVADADADVDEEGNGVVIDDNETPLAGGMEAEVEDGDEEITAIEDTEVPMATAEEDGMSWWWLLLIAILGATGYKMYKKHQEKKAALAGELDK